MITKMLFCLVLALFSAGALLGALLALIAPVWGLVPVGAGWTIWRVSEGLE